MSTNFFTGIELPDGPGNSFPAMKPRDEEKAKKPRTWRDVKDFVPSAGHSGELGTSSAAQAAYKILQTFEKSEGGKKNFLFSGFPQLDSQALGWLAPGKVIGIVGNSGGGKSALAWQLAEAVQNLNTNKRSVVSSGEMPDVDYCARYMAAWLSNHKKSWACDARAIAAGVLPDNSLECRAALKAAALAFAGLKVSFVNQPGFVEDLLLQVAGLSVQLKKSGFCPADESPIGCLVVDYLQLVESREKSDTQAQSLGKIAYDLKAFSAAVGAPVVVLLQVNREVGKRAESEKVLGLSDIKDSATIGQAMDEIFILQRPEKMVYNPELCPDYSGFCYLTHAKGRQGSCVSPQILRWYDGAYREIPPEIYAHLRWCYPLQALKNNPKGKKPELAGLELQKSIDERFVKVALARGWHTQSTALGVSTINSNFPSFLAWKDPGAHLMPAPGFVAGGGVGSENTAAGLGSENTGGSGSGPEGMDGTGGPVGPVGPDGTVGPVKKKPSGTVAFDKIGGGKGGAK